MLLCALATNRDLRPEICLTVRSPLVIEQRSDALDIHTLCRTLLNIRSEVVLSMWLLTSDSVVNTKSTVIQLHCNTFCRVSLKKCERTM